MRADVIVVDDLPVAIETAEAIYRVFDAVYERRSIAPSSDLHPAGFAELIPKTIANATVDRLLSHTHLVLTTGDSWPPLGVLLATTGQDRCPPPGTTNLRLTTEQNALMEHGFGCSGRGRSVRESGSGPLDTLRPL
jgi:hypothetical protein